MRGGTDEPCTNSTQARRSNADAETGGEAAAAIDRSGEQTGDAVDWPSDATKIWQIAFDLAWFAQRINQKESYVTG